MIGRVLERGKRVYGLLWYLYSPGKACVHSNPHLVSGWRHPAELEPPLRDDGKRDFRRLTGLLEQPLAVLGEDAPAKPVWHCTVRAAPGDPDLGDGAWMRIAAEIMHRTGLSRYGEEDQGVRWVAVHHGENHIHIAATLGRQDGRRARLESGTNWGRRLRLDATGAESDGSVRILGGCALSWRATVASGTSPVGRAAPASHRRHQPSGQRSALIAGLSSDGPTREGEGRHDAAGRGIRGLRHRAGVREAPGAAVGCRGCAGGGVRARSVGEPVRL